MAYNETLAEKTALSFEAKGTKFTEKKMFGGLCFMVDDKMCVGVNADNLMVRLDPEIYEEVLKKDGCREMDFTGRAMKGFVYIDERVLKTQKQIGYWVGLALEFNPKAKSSKRKKTKK